MKKLKRTAVALLAVIMVLTSSACGKNTKWCFKDENQELAIGVYIYNLIQAYSNAYSLVEDTSVSVFDQKVEGIDASEWIVNQATEECKKLMVIDDLMKKYNLTLTDEEKADAESNANYYWSYYKSVYEDLGISKTSYINAAYLYSQKYYKVFYEKYNESVVSSEEIEKYFLENYTDYTYFSIPLTTTDENDKTVNLSDEEIASIKAQFDNYVKMINEDGKTLEDVSKQYSADHSDKATASDDTNNSSNVSEDTNSSDNSTNSEDTNNSTESVNSEDSNNSDNSDSSTNSEGSSSSTEDTKDEEQEEDKNAPDMKNDIAILSKSSIGDELKKAIEKLEEGEAGVVEVGTSYYFIYKGKINDSLELIEDESGRHTVLNAMKGEEFSEYIDSLAETYSYERNEDALNKYGIEHIKSALE